MKTKIILLINTSIYLEIFVKVSFLHLLIASQVKFHTEVCPGEKVLFPSSFPSVELLDHPSFVP